MTDLVKKEKIAGIICYLVYSATLTYQNHNLFSLVYFATVAIVIFMADRLFAENAPVKKTLTAFFVTAVGYQSMFGIFRSVHNDIEQVLTSVAVAVFFACVFSFTDKKKFPFCIVAAPVLCFLNVKIAVCYSVFLLCLSIMGTVSAKHKENKKGLSHKNLAIISIAVSVICSGVSLYLLITSDNYIIENLNYLLVQFKNPPALIIASVYLVIKLFKNGNINNAVLGICIAIFTAATILTTILFGWSLFATFCLSITLFLGILCLNDTKSFTLIKADYEKHKFIFWIIIICALQ